MYIELTTIMRTRKMVRNVGDKAFFETLWESAVALRGALQPSEYKHPVLATRLMNRRKLSSLF